MKNRFDKLSALTRGAAIVGLGVGAAACSKTDPSPQAQTATDVAADDALDAGAGPDGTALRFRRRLPIPNAIPPRFRRARDAGNPDTDGSPDDSSGP